MPASNAILLTTDLQPASDKVAEVACDLATTLGSELVALHVLTDEAWEEIRTDVPPESAYLDVVLGNLTRDVATQVARAAGDRQIQHSAKVVEGEPGREILRMLEAQPFAYVVAGVRNRSRVGKLLLGSVTQEVLLKSPYPIVAVPI